MLSVFQPLSRLKLLSVQEKSVIEKLFEDTNARLWDVVLQAPRKIVDWGEVRKIADVQNGETVCLVVRVLAHDAPPHRSKRPYTLTVEDNTGVLYVPFFARQTAYLAKAHPVGEIRVLYGQVRVWNGVKQMAHPDRMITLSAFEKQSRFEPLYASSKGVTQRQLRGLVQSMLLHVPDWEWHSEEVLKSKQWSRFLPALHALHSVDMALRPKALQRLSYDEALSHQLLLGLLRAHTTLNPPNASSSLPPFPHARTVTLENSLPFPLTPDQKHCLADISQDLRRGVMLRLVQGDVGSGKTVVALLGIVEALSLYGGQAAVMAPTDILARQHFATLSKFGAVIGLRVALLTGREKGKAREKLLRQLECGEIDILIGTQALLQPPVVFQKLTFVVIDEQHRFGVNQRLALTQKGESVHTCLLSATPIPRSLALTLYGDMDISEIKTKPSGRKPILTTLTNLSSLSEVIERLKTSLQEGAKAYWICPLIEANEEDENQDAPALARYDSLHPLFGESVAVLHGRMKGDEKNAVMEKFQSGEVRLLVSTTVVEVGVDVSDATIILIENAEKFGLAQLHQLRGRVGRSDLQSYCVLLYGAPLSQTARKRLQVMRDTTDGFKIAEEDLKLRGPGDVLGFKQSGAPDFRILDLNTDVPLLLAAREEAKFILAQDPNLSTSMGQKYRPLISIFHREDALGRFFAG